MNSYLYDESNWNGIIKPLKTIAPSVGPFQVEKTKTNWKKLEFPINPKIIEMLIMNK